MVAQDEVGERLQKLSSLKDRLFTLSSDRNRFLEEGRKHAAQRDQLNAEVKKLSAEIRECRTKRDQLNAEVKKMKLERDSIRDDIKKRREDFQKLQDKIKKLRQRVGGSYASIKRQIDDIDWKIQTEPMPTKEENKLVAEVKNLASLMPMHSHIRDLEDKLFEMKAELGGKRMHAERIHKQLTALAEESEKYHQRLLELSKPFAAIKKEADQAHENYITLMQEAYKAKGEYVAHMARIYTLRKEIGTIKVERKSKAEEAVRKRMEDAALEKMKTGKKMSFEEFKVLMERGSPP